MAKTGYKAYALALTQLGLGISPQGIKWCWRFAIPPEDVRARLPELQRMGFIRSPKQRYALSEAKAERGASADARAQRAIDRMIGGLRAQGWQKGSRGG